MSDKKENSVLQVLRNTIRIAKVSFNENKVSFLLILISTLLIMAGPFLSSAIFAKILDELVSLSGEGVLSESIIYLIVIYLLLNILIPLIIRFKNYLENIQWFFLEEKFEMDLINKKGSIDIATREDPKENDLIQKVTENGVMRCQNFNERTFLILENFTSVIVASAILVFFNKYIFFAILIGTIPGLIVEIKYAKDVWSIQNSKAETKRRFWNLKEHFQNAGNAVELKIFQNTNFFSKSIQKLFKNFLSEQKKNEDKKFKYVFFAQLLIQIIIAVSVLWFIVQVVYGAITIGALSFAVASINRLRGSLTALFSRFGRQYQSSLFITDYFKFLDKKEVIKEPERGVKLDKNKVPEIIFENVSFAYPNTKKKILKNFSLKINKGDKVALVGINGAGKTTFVKLLCRFYDPTEGRILINGVDLKEINLNTWYRQLGVLFQDYAQYHFLVKDSIAIGDTSKKTQIEKVKESAKAGEADIFIEEWEENYDQMLGKHFTGGVEPSIGQWQKLALARVFYRDPKVLILDEPTSSIDAEAEAKIFERIEKISKKRSMILISHRFSTVRRADRIVVIDGGKIIENGTHEELMEVNGQYAKLFNLQAEKYQ
ncbi:MAG: ABC transporter ATP-binding protein [Candidatus Pacebacteria bacterium]|nr:ABC transporter ATP-binding protein [Candidatus Paceibacterota bacterium]